MHHDRGHAAVALAFGVNRQEVTPPVVQINRLTVDQGIDDLFPPALFLLQVRRLRRSAQREQQRDNPNSNREALHSHLH